mgnify:CR=1 FL=1
MTEHDILSPEERAIEVLTNRFLEIENRLNNLEDQYDFLLGVAPLLKEILDDIGTLEARIDGIVMHWGNHLMPDINRLKERKQKKTNVHEPF